MEKGKDNAEQLKKQYVRIAISIIGIVICSILATIFIRKAFTWKEVNEGSNYTYQTIKNTNYQVQLVSNSFIQKNPQGPDELYIARLIQSIPATFTYQFNSPKRADLSYSYRVEARVIANYKAGNDESGEANEVWNKQYSLIPTITKRIGMGSSFSISQPVAIDYNTYQAEVAAFIRQLALSVDAELRVNMIIDINGTSETGEKIEKTDTVSTIIPLNEDVFKISRDKNVVTDEKKTMESKLVTNVDYSFLAVGVIFFGIALACVIVVGVELLRRSRKSKYYTEVRKILNDYGEIIVEVTNPFDTMDKDVIYLKNFNEMVDLEQELRIPILCYQDDLFGHTSFAIIQEKTVYLFELKKTTTDDSIQPIDPRRGV